MIRESVDLQPFNTLALHARARYFCEATNPDELQAALAFAQQHQLSVLPLGEGSNVVLTQDYPGFVLRVVDQAIRVELEDDNNIVLRVGAGMLWRRLVEKTLEHGWYGLENLALIPGTVGAAPVQNIGAYGVEISRFVESVSAIHMDHGTLHALDNAQCQFRYRDSMFKHGDGKRLIITSVALRLSKQPKVMAGYAGVQHWLQQHGIVEPTPQHIFEAVCDVRRSRLPDPSVLPNVGSFFKNPQVDAQHFARLQAQYPDVVFYPGEQGRIKLAAAWLIDQLGWKGRCVGDACVHERQALVIVNRNAASAEEVMALSDAIAADVAKTFSVQLEREPVVW